MGKPSQPGRFELTTRRRMKVSENGKDLKEIAKRIAKVRHCNCDLDVWEPERTTGHSWVCRIHKIAMTAAFHYDDLSDGIKSILDP